MLSFQNTYSELPDRFFARMEPSPVRAPELIKVNVGLAEALGLNADFLSSPEGLDMLSGNRFPETAEPIAMAYAGHQFGNFVPQLGDGRAVLVGEVVDPHGVRFDLHLKGSGRTPFSRGGDGRAAVGPVLREYIVAEAMHALGIPTTRALAAVKTGEPVYREARLPGAVLARVARSHVRVGTFQYFAAREDVDAIARLGRHVIDRLYPELGQADRPALALLETVVERQARLVAQWMSVGFIHGVMNTDNMAVSGETIDFGPCAFMDFYHPGRVYSSIDHYGRYAFGNQPAMAQWNLAQFAQCLLPLIDEDMEAAVAPAQAAIDAFPALFEREKLALFSAKLGLSEPREGDGELLQELLEAMSRSEADFTLTFRRLAESLEEDTDRGSRSLFVDPTEFDRWAAKWRARLGEEGVSLSEIAARLNAANPIYIPRNHMVEEALQAAVENDDTGPFETLLDVLADPFTERAGLGRYALPPEPGEEIRQTFCGT
ncbi:uncharacterized protein YdiU (UPF0061 family) [Rhodobium orientis]|uniref:Protein nucleotidyltransferase YdiU n=1 Tax=Rhodobium orientis TaxID=34017 RepID=A0A327JLT2_9HYPH|nr:YdiU family protein [Rhodobium orientis]MBB4304835.1 uncharacterized protein YdiU (UPF0061 family) [Rhodobium orientis]MBK5947993.1 hypothetical protein [Rhodobium orientis]RAI27430.1 hypothetical protein CH339_10070 [Rhodobium orientis]